MITIIYIVSALTLFFFSYGHNVFSPSEHKWILFYSASFIVLTFVIFSICYCIDIFFEAWLLSFVPPIALNILFIINTFYILNLSWLNIVALIVFWALIVALGIAILAGIWFLGYYKAEQDFMKKNIEQSLRTERTWNTNASAISLIGASREKTNAIIDKIYKYLVANAEEIDKSKYFMSYTIEKELKNMLKELPPLTQQLLLNRLSFNDFFRVVRNINSVEFIRLIIPEYNNTTTIGNIQLQERLFEDLSSQITKLVVNNTMKQDMSMDNIKLFQTQIREVFHTLVTPVRTIVNSISIINKSRSLSNFESVLHENLKRITVNSEVIISLLYAYRGIAFSMNYTESSISVKEFLSETIKGLNLQLDKKVKLDINDAEYVIEGYNRNLVFALLLPLLQNAVEASSSSGKVEVIQRRDLAFDEVIIKNRIEETIDVNELHAKIKTKNHSNSSTFDEHEGLGIRSVQSIADSMQIGFDYFIDQYIFTSILKFPVKAKEDD
jgi:hypothetical protein